MTDQPGPDQIQRDLNTNVAHPARVYDYWLGGKDNFPADGAAAEQAMATLPNIALGARANRRFLKRVVSFLAGEAGVRQFLDLGTGIPTSPNVHEVAQGVAPDSRIVYVDNDPIVLVHARALLTSTPQGVTDYVDADLRDPGKILRAAGGTIDFERPVAVMLLTILQLISDEEDPHAIVARLLEAMPSGSYLVVSHPARDIQAVAAVGAAELLSRLMPVRVTLRTLSDTQRFFDGLELVEPGVVQVQRWRPGAEEANPEREVSIYGGVARKP